MSAAKSIATKTTTRKAAEAAARDVDWIRNAPRSQLQKKFKHAKVFGMKGNSNNKTLDAYKKALESHIKSPDTIVKKGTLHQKPVTHYYNPKTKLNIVRDQNDNFLSAWELKGKQISYMEKTGNIGGAK